MTDKSSQSHEPDQSGKPPARPPDLDTLREGWRVNYQAAVRVAGADAVHSVIARAGLAVLGKGLPYLVVAARNRRRSESAGPSARREVPTPDPDATTGTSPWWDLTEQVIASSESHRLLAALADLDDADLLIVWRHAEGVPDTEIRAEWTLAGYEPRGRPWR